MIKSKLLSRLPRLRMTDIIRGPDGKIVMTKLAAATAHLLLAMTVAYVTILKQDFIMEMWSLYLGCTILHEQANKAMTKYAAFKDKKLDVECNPDKDAK